jgi:RNA polymerase sigma-70 factor (ECF subfamily)
MDRVDPDDGDLVARSRGGDRDAFSALVVRYQDRIWNAVYQRLGDSDAALDVAQEAFVNAFRSLDGFRAESSFFGWLFTIAMNETRDYVRKKVRSPEKSSLDAERGDGLTGHDLIAAPEAGHAKDDEQHAEHEVRAALQELDEDDARVIVLKDIEGLAYIEIAKLLGWPVGQAKSKVHRARLRLKRKLELRERARAR